MLEKLATSYALTGILLGCVNTSAAGLQSSHSGLTVESPEISVIQTVEIEESLTAGQSFVDLDAQSLHAEREDGQVVSWRRKRGGTEFSGSIDPNIQVATGVDENALATVAAHYAPERGCEVVAADIKATYSFGVFAEHCADRDETRIARLSYSEGAVGVIPLAITREEVVLLDLGPSMHPRVSAPIAMILKRPDSGRYSLVVGSWTSPEVL